MRNKVGSRGLLAISSWQLATRILPLVRGLGGCFWLVAICLLLSCGSRKVERYTQSAESSQQSAVSSRQVAESQERTAESSQQLADSLFFNIEENTAQPTIVEVIKGNQKYKIKTFSKINIGQKKTAESHSQVAFRNTQTTIHNTQTAKSEQRTASSQKQTNRRAYPWYWFVFWGIVAWEFGKFFFRKYVF